MKNDCLSLDSYSCRQGLNSLRGQQRQIVFGFIVCTNDTDAQEHSDNSHEIASSHLQGSDHAEIGSRGGLSKINCAYNSAVRAVRSCKLGTDRPSSKNILLKTDWF